jgi:hypothetical protein
MDTAFPTPWCFEDFMQAFPHGEDDCGFMSSGDAPIKPLTDCLAKRREQKMIASGKKKTRRVFQNKGNDEI